MAFKTVTLKQAQHWYDNLIPEDPDCDYECSECGGQVDPSTGVCTECEYREFDPDDPGPLADADDEIPPEYR